MHCRFYHLIMFLRCTHRCRTSVKRMLSQRDLGICQFSSHTNNNITVASTSAIEKVPATTIINNIMQKLTNQGYTIMKTDAGLPIVELFIDEGVNTDLLTEALTKKPELLNVSPARMRPKVDLLKDLGFTIDDCLLIFSFCPPIIGRPTEDIYKICETMRFVGFKSEDIRGMIMKRPQVFSELTPEKLKHFHDNIQNMFSRNQAVGLMTQFPDLCFEDFATFEKKFEYLYYNMGYENIDMVKSKRWIFEPLFYTRCRHECLVRTGSFVRPHRKKPTLSKHNPRIGQIFDTPPKVFAQQVCLISLEEFEVFQRMYARQLHFQNENTATETFGEDQVVIEVEDDSNYDEEEEEELEDIHENFGEQFVRQKGYYPIN